MKEIWPGFETVRLIGRGSYGAVYEVKKKDPSGEYFSAVKKIVIPSSDNEYETLQDNGYSDEEITAYFESRMKSIVSEFQLMEKFKGNSNIVSYEDHMVVEHEDGAGWDVLIRMELLESLPNLIKRTGNLSRAEAIKLGKDMCDALTLIQTENIVHRDIKPQNILVNRYGAYKLSDFGIARTMDHVTKATMAGTPDYIAPEVYHKEEYGMQADQYSLGLVLYWVFNERRLPFYPLTGKLTAQLIEDAKARRMKGEQLPPPVHADQELAEVILKACAYKPQDRFETIGELRKALKRCEKEEDPKDADYESVQTADTQEQTEPEEEDIIEENFDSEKTFGFFSSKNPVKNEETAEAEETVSPHKNEESSEEDFESGETIGFFSSHKTSEKTEPEAPKKEESEDALKKILELCARAIDADRSLRLSEADELTQKAMSLAKRELYPIGLAYTLGAFLNVRNAYEEADTQYKESENTVVYYKAGGKAKELWFPKNISRALEWLKKAADQNHDFRACIVLASIYETVNSVQDYSAALRYLEMAQNTDPSFEYRKNFYQDTLKRVSMKKDGGMDVRLANILKRYEPYFEKRAAAVVPVKEDMFSILFGTMQQRLTDQEYKTHNVYIGSYLTQGVELSLNKRKAANSKEWLRAIENHLKNEKILCAYYSEKQIETFIFTEKSMYLFPFWWQKKNQKNPAKNNEISMWVTPAQLLWVDYSVIDQVINPDKKTVIMTFNTDQKEFKNFGYWINQQRDMSSYCNMLEEILSVYRNRDVNINEETVLGKTAITLNGFRF